MSRSRPSAVFDPKNICWGYRDIFSNIIERLYQEKLLGPQSEDITEQFFRTMAKSEQNLFEYVLYDFLKSLNMETRWIMSLPALFSDITETGCRMAEYRLYFGTAYFRCLGKGEMGKTLEQVRYLLDTLRRLWQINEDLAFGFLRGYFRIVD